MPCADVVEAGSTSRRTSVVNLVDLVRRLVQLRGAPESSNWALIFQCPLLERLVSSCALTLSSSVGFPHIGSLRSSRVQLWRVPRDRPRYRTQARQRSRRAGHHCREDVRLHFAVLVAGRPGMLEVLKQLSAARHRTRSSLEQSTRPQKRSRRPAGPRSRSSSTSARLTRSNRRAVHSRAHAQTLC